MLSYFFSNQPTFETQLQEFLAQGPNALNEALLHKIMAAIRGEDPQLKSQIAFATLVKAIASFDMSKGSTRLLRELVIFDKLVQENIYCDEISKITLFALQASKSGSESSINGSSLRMLRLYWKLIKDRSIVISSKDHIFQQKRSQRRHYFERLKLPVVLKQINIFQSFFASIFELIYLIEGPQYSQQSKPSGGVIQYVILHLLYKLLYLYNCQLMAQKHLLHHIPQLSHTDLLRLKQSIIKFRQHCNKFINFIKAHQRDKGFQLIHFQEIKVDVNQKFIAFIDNFLKSQQTDSIQASLQALPVSIGKILVEKKPMNKISKSSHNSRLTIKTDYSTTNKKENPEGNSFLNWHNSFSHEFPQKEIMTVDLIMQLKVEEKIEKQDEQDSFREQRYISRCSYDNRSTNISSNYEVHYLIRQSAIKTLQKMDFDNIYSKVSIKWNQS